MDKLHIMKLEKVKINIDNAIRNFNNGNDRIASADIDFAIDNLIKAKYLHEAEQEINK